MENEEFSQYNNNNNNLETIEAIKTKEEKEEDSQYNKEEFITININNGVAETPKIEDTEQEFVHLQYLFRANTFKTQVIAIGPLKGNKTREQLALEKIVLFTFEEIKNLTSIEIPPEEPEVKTNQQKKRWTAAREIEKKFDKAEPLLISGFAF